MEQLTDRQRAILEYVVRHIAEERFPPTIREIGQAMGIRSTNGVNDHLKALERKGYLERGEMKSRALVPTRVAWKTVGVRQPGIPAAGEPPALRALAGGRSGPPSPIGSPRLVGGPDDLLDVPVLGRVAAGAPILAEENHESTMRIDPSLLGRGSKEGIFALRIQGDSMIGDGILDGDLVFVRSQPTARTGEIVVAMIEGEATVKRFYPEGDRIRLQPSNPALAPIYIHGRDARAADIVGVVVGVFRQI
ncbi:MAG TPA: transcriptional repressor LexA [Vulgatibacter sp.]|nr:transcriptional repressor LexA [Vulgatibacter sp.]